MPPPPAEPFASRVFLGPALRTQPDRRLVKLVREGYEAAFEEIVRRYRKPLDRFAAAIVGARSEDVTQDAFSKALLALRGTEQEIELRPWLYRIVRNTALNDLRDATPLTEELGEAVGGGRSAAVEAERREEIAELMERLRALPEPQRAAIVMRELEGLSHEEIAAALGVSGGAARQAIYRARLALRDGLGLLVPLPLLRLLFEHGAEAAAGAGGAAAAAGAASIGGGGAAGGLGAGAALKVGVATALVAGSVGAGVAIQQDRGGDGSTGPPAAEAAQLRGGSEGDGGSGSQGPSTGPNQAPPSGPGEDRGGSNHGHGNEAGEGGDDRRGHGNGTADEAGDDASSHGGGRDDSAGHGGRGPSRGGHSGPNGGHGGSSGGRETGGKDDLSGGESEGSGSRGGASGDDRSGNSGHGPGEAAVAPPPSEPPPADPGDDADGGGSRSGGDGSGASGGDDDL
ncbi:MAG TPA: RNA polymerase sigma factor [Solirubrobacterales bacterium]|nr:RNA polymerase sigma factor [Solirubrobacterales bacterium]